MSKELELLIKWKQRLIDLNFEESEKTKTQKNRDYYRGLNEKLTKCIEELIYLFNNSHVYGSELLLSWKEILHNLKFREGPYADSDHYQRTETFYYNGLRDQLDICVLELFNLLKPLKFKNEEDWELKILANRGKGLSEQDKI